MSTPCREWHCAFASSSLHRTEPISPAWTSLASNQTHLITRKIAPYKQCASLGTLEAHMQCRTAPTLGACWDVARWIPSWTRRVAIQVGCSQLAHGHVSCVNFVLCTSRCWNLRRLVSATGCEAIGRPKFRLLGKRHVDEG